MVRGRMATCPLFKRRMLRYGSLFMTAIRSATLHTAHLWTAHTAHMPTMPFPVDHYQPDNRQTSSKEKFHLILYLIDVHCEVVPQGLQGFPRMLWGGGGNSHSGSQGGGGGPPKPQLHMLGGGVRLPKKAETRFFGGGLDQRMYLANPAYSG